MGYEFAEITIDKIIEKYGLTISKEEKIELIESVMYAYCIKHNKPYIKSYTWDDEF